MGRIEAPVDFGRLTEYLSPPLPLQANVLFSAVAGIYVAGYRWLGSCRPDVAHQSSATKGSNYKWLATKTVIGGRLATATCGYRWLVIGG